MGRFARWSTSLDEYPIAVGGKAAGFVVKSSFRPGWTTAYVGAGEGIHLPTAVPGPVREEISVLARPEIKNSLVLTIGPKFSPDATPQWVASDWNLGVQKLVNRGRLSDSAYIQGLMYADGEGVLKDDAEAVRWYRLAADQGDALAQLSLGLKYADGEGVLKDSVLAHMWSNIAGANGNARARENRDNLERDMTRAEISRATEAGTGVLWSSDLSRIASRKQGLEHTPCPLELHRSSIPSPCCHEICFAASIPGRLTGRSEGMTVDEGKGGMQIISQ